ncbi:MAG: TIGR04076 family protein [Candidatus Margulisiibacteriota bacterium]|nr:MAG: hypothetical protein A2X43_10795 [Candidatus Margulisbacteria bacterium GWD2_39_127]OGI03405.1 MAG: hypothetical protein A2X42_03440 [Candidatus Margulisbacteria bacterium GWF2_38_17]OGI06560.1 MAG: hypothetical protein A2X41_00440 [Candidatus Margulisbacteria bacterium GWE2_39_32]PZM81918.1 MAG: TIGR04076 family protein [Candidatus Margulisiibacteriota bacterium]HAR64091.1 TIGR04076 family protein [Candidatus Margulisiibacteriota bacterium]
MPRCKITVIKKTLNQDIAKEYCQSEISTCPSFQVGQSFIAGFEKPAGFCDWAWNDIVRYVVVILTGGNFASGIFAGWMKDENAMIACCTDGVRPVVFKLERLED